MSRHITPRKTSKRINRLCNKLVSTADREAHPVAEKLQAAISHQMERLRATAFRAFPPASALASLSPDQNDT